LKNRSSFCRSSHRGASRSSNEHKVTELHDGQKRMFSKDKKIKIRKDSKGTTQA
jgi:hypothetical protein